MTESEAKEIRERIKRLNLSVMIPILEQMELGDGIRTLRKVADLNGSTLASLLGVSRVSITNWETGNVDPNAEHRKAIANLFGVPLEVLF